MTSWVAVIVVISFPPTNKNNAEMRGVSTGVFTVFYLNRKCITYALRMDIRICIGWTRAVDDCCILL